jgi:3-methyladenine DNA glycosylase AlkD
MQYAQAMKELEALGTAQNRKVYARHGVGEPMFGVSYAGLGKLAKAIRVDHGLAERLWKSGNHDARVLATMVADPAETKSATLDAWAQELDNYALADAFSKLAAATPHARQKAERWTKAKGEWTSSAGWNVLAMLSADDGLPDAFFEPWLATIEAGIEKAKNRTRYAMNNALIAIGMRSDALAKQAVAAAQRIGAVEVDHGETGCKTPDAVAYVPKAREHQRKKQVKRKPARRS